MCPLGCWRKAPMCWQQLMGLGLGTVLGPVWGQMITCVAGSS